MVILYFLRDYLDPSAIRNSIYLVVLDWTALTPNSLQTALEFRFRTPTFSGGLRYCPLVHNPVHTNETN